MREFRYKDPDVFFIGYNGLGEDMENTVTPFRKAVDLCQSEALDTMYCGDPCLSDVSMMNFWYSQGLCSDYMTSQYLLSGVPIQRINNCASMIGTTDTCCNRALNAWRGMMILTMARGSWLNICHGNIDLLGDDDAYWMAKVQQLYMKVQQYGSISTFDSIPGKALPYGYAAFAEKGNLYTVVSASRGRIKVILPEATGTGRVPFTDSSSIPVLEKNIVGLSSEQMTVAGYGKLSAQGYDSDTEKDTATPATVQKVETDVQKKSEHTLQTHYISSEGKTVRILFQRLGEHGKVLRSWGGAPPVGIKMDHSSSIEVKQGRRAVPIKKSHDKMIWCGLSQAAGEVSADDIKGERPLEISCTTTDGNSEHCLLEVYEVEYFIDKK